MANRPFTIQDNAISLNGVEIQAAVDGKVVIPGITASAGYRVEEVEDTGDQTQTWNAPTVIDNARYDYLVGTYLGVGYTPAEYIAQLDDDGYIDEIRVDVPGVLPATDTAELTVDFMWATDVVDPFLSFDANAWTQIPFKTKIRATTIEGDPQAPFGTGSGGVVKRTVNFPQGEEGDTRGTLALTPDNNLYVCIADYVALENQTFEPETAQDFDTAQTGNNTLAFEIVKSEYSDITAILDISNTPSEWTISAEIDGIGETGPWTVTDITSGIASGGEWVGQDIWTFFVPDPGNVHTSFNAGTPFTLTYTAGSQPAIWETTGGASDRLTNSNGAEVVLDESDNLIMPSGGAIWFDFGYIDQDTEEDSDALRISGGTGVTIKAATDSTTWRFNDNGTITFPDGSVQSTAYTGQAGGGSSGELYIMANVDGSVTTSTDGIEWGPSTLSGLAGIGKMEVHGGVIVYAGAGNGPYTFTGLYYSTAIGTASLCTGTNTYNGSDIFWYEVHFFADTDTWVAVGAIDDTHYYPVVAHSTNGIAWTVVPVDATYVDSYNTPNAGWELRDVIYDSENGAYVICGRINDQSLKSGVFVTSDITAPLDGANHVLVNANFSKLAPLSVVGYGGPPGYIIAVDGDTDNTLWTGWSTDPNNWSTGFVDWANACQQQLGYVPLISEITFNNTSVLIATEDGQVGVSVIGMGIYFLINVPLPFTTTTFTISNANPAVITFNTGEAAKNNEMIVVSGAGEYNGTYYVNTGTGVLYTDQAMTTALDASGFAAFTSGTITFSHGQYFDAAGAANSYYFLGNDDEQIFRSTNGGQTWTQVQDITGEFFNDFAYGTFGNVGVDLHDVQSDITFTQENKGRIAKFKASNDAWIDCIAIDLNGNTYATGGYYPNSWDDDQPALIKFNSQGEVVWTQKILFDNDSTNTSTFTRVKWWNDYVYVMGYRYYRSTEKNTYGEDRSFVLKFDANSGSLIDNNTWYWSGTPGEDLYLYDLDFLSDGSPVAVGRTDGGGRRLKLVTPAAGQQNTVWLTTSDLYDVDPVQIYPSWNGSSKLFGPNISTGGESLTPFYVYDVPTQTVTGHGTGLRVTVRLGYTLDGSDYLPNGTYDSIDIVNYAISNSGYVTGDTVKVLGTYLGGTTPANDLTFTVLASSGESGSVYGYQTKSGTAPTTVIPFSTWHDVNFSGTVGVGGTYEIGAAAGSGVVVVTPNWQATFNSPNDNWDWARSIAVANGGQAGNLSFDRIFVPTAMYDGSNYRNVVNVLNGEGSVLEQVIIDSGDIDNWQDAGTVAVDSNANSYYSFIDYNGDDDTTALCIVKMDINYNITRVRQTNAEINWNEVPSIFVDALDNPYIGGQSWDEVLNAYVFNAVKLNPTNLNIVWNKAIRSLNGNNPSNYYNEPGAYIAVSEDWIHCTFGRYDGNKDNAFVFLLPNNALDIADNFFADDDTWAGAIGHITLGSNAFGTSGYEAGSVSTQTEAENISNPFSTYTYNIDDAALTKQNLDITNYGVENVNHITFTDGTTLKSATPEPTIARWTNPQTETDWWIDTWNGAWTGYLTSRQQTTIEFTVSIGYTSNNQVTVSATTNQILQFANYPEKNDIDTLTYEMSFDGGVTWTPVSPNIYSPDPEGTLRFNLWDWRTGNNTYVATTVGQVVKLRYYTGRAKVWFDAGKSPSGYNRFRGAKIDYHAYVEGEGTIIGTIHIADDRMGQSLISHTEVASGSDNVGGMNFWYMNDELTNGDRGILVQGFPGYSGNVAVQWTATMFYGNDYWGD